MDLQMRVINRYFKIFGKKTLKEISTHTGIQITRVFRILNGSEMKLSEFSVFYSLVNAKLGTAGELIESAMESRFLLSDGALSEMDDAFKRKIKLASILNHNKQITA